MSHNLGETRSHLCLSSPLRSSDRRRESGGAGKGGAPRPERSGGTVTQGSSRHQPSVKVRRTLELFQDLLGQYQCSSLLLERQPRHRFQLLALANKLGVPSLEAARASPWTAQFVGKTHQQRRLGALVAFAKLRLMLRLTSFPLLGMEGSEFRPCCIFQRRFERIPLGY